MWHVIPLTCRNDELIDAATTRNANNRRSQKKKTTTTTMKTKNKIRRERYLTAIS